ncbi:hypothetical protein GCM10023094_10090 [Rhodococcus olei]|uniref:Uncharacterized protein n=1 Tax=Rhodococcus olei TaxID=2161675 RepID=A0ABP8NY00_9NOCA
MRRCPDDEIGRNSVRPWTIPRTIACSQVIDSPVTGRAVRPRERMWRNGGTGTGSGDASRGAPYPRRPDHARPRVTVLRTRRVKVPRTAPRHYASDLVVIER